MDPVGVTVRMSLCSLLYVYLCLIGLCAPPADENPRGPSSNPYGMEDVRSCTPTDDIPPTYTTMDTENILPHRVHHHPVGDKPVYAAFLL